MKPDEKNEKNEKIDVPQGTLDLMILTILAREPMHGYGISQRLQTLSRDHFKVNPGSLFPSLYRLEQDGRLKAEWRATENNRRAKYYRLTASGRKQLEQQRERYSRAAFAVTSVLEGVMFLDRLASALRRFVQPRRADRQLDDDLQTFIEMSVGDRMRDGVAPDEARRLAMLELGGIDQVKERVRSVQSGVWLENLGRDLRYAIRMLRRHPGFALVTVLCLSLGIGANTAVFSVFSAMLLRPLPYGDADRLGIVYKTGRTQPDQMSTFGPAEFLDWRDGTQSLESLAMYVPWSPSLTDVEQAEQLTGIRASGSLLQTLGVTPLLGRTFHPADEASGERVVVISHRLWQQTFHGDPTLVNKDVILDGQRHIVIGIMPPAFQFPGRQVDLWSLLTISRDRIDRGETGFLMLARLRSGESWEHARTELDARIAGMRREDAKTYDEAAAGVVPLRDWLIGASQQRTLWLLLGAVTVLLLTTCANVANLMLAHSSARRQEIRLRLALGATPGRVIGQLLTEYMVLGALGCAIGMLLSLWARSAFVNLLPAGSPYQLVPVVLDWRVASYAVLLSLGSVVAAGLLPALRAVRADLSTSGARVTRVNVRAALLIVQTAATVVLLAGAVLLVRSFMNVWNINPGFSRTAVLATRISLPAGRPPAAQTDFYERLLERISSAPQIESAGAVSFLPLSGQGSGGYITIEGRPDLDLARGTQPGAARLSVTPGFFETLAIPVLEGRTFAQTDTPSTPLVVINRAFARQFFPDASPIGRRIKRGTLPAPFPWMTIVGVVGDVKLLSLFDDAQPTVFLAHAQTPAAAMTVVLRTAATPGVVMSHVRSAVRGLDQNLPVGAVRAFDDIVLDSLADARFPMLWIACFSILAVVLSALGVYGVVSYALAQRRREFVIRLALGASPSGLIRLALRCGLWPTAIGCAVGLVAALALGHLLETLVYGVDVRDRTSLMVALVLPLVVALASSYPAVRRVVGQRPSTILHID